MLASAADRQRLTCRGPRYSGPPVSSELNFEPVVELFDRLLALNRKVNSTTFDPRHQPVKQPSGPSCFCPRTQKESTVNAAVCRRSRRGAAAPP